MTLPAAERAQAGGIARSRQVPDRRGAGARSRTEPHLPPLSQPGSWLGLLGGGQLGRMFCMAAQSLGYRVCVLDPGADSPAGSVADRHLVAADTSTSRRWRELAAPVRSVTTEFENVPACALEFLAGHVVVSPACRQRRDRTGPHAREGVRARLRPRRRAVRRGSQRRRRCAPPTPALFPAILKAARLGYDGKGQARVDDAARGGRAFESFGGVPCVLERRLPLAIEVSVVVARGFDGQAVAYPVAENVHRGGILAVSTVPARDLAGPRASVRRDATLTIARALDYVGVLCVEFFVLPDGSLVVNEMAPRPHNSGHYTIDACVTSQFEQQVRVMAGLPLGSTHQHRPRGDAQPARRPLVRGTPRRARAARARLVAGAAASAGEAAPVRQVRGATAAARWAT